MSIVSTVVTVADSAEIDGRRYVSEYHTDHLGVVHWVRYLAVADADTAAIATARAALIVEQLAATEADALIGQD